MNILCVLPRTDNNAFGLAADQVNTHLESKCPEMSIEFVKQGRFVAEDFQDDGVHLAKKGVGRLVSNYKTKINPQLGMSAYIPHTPQNRADRDYRGG